MGQARVDLRGAHRQGLKKLGVPTSRDVQALMDRIDALSAQVASRTKTAAKKTGAKTGARAATKKAAKRAPRKAAA